MQIKGLSGKSHTQTIDPGATVHELLRKLPPALFASDGLRLFHKVFAGVMKCERINPTSAVKPGW